MKKLIFSLCLAALTIAAAGQKASELKYTDARELMLINQGFDNTALPYSRLPEDLKEVTRKEVWDLGLNSAGLAVRFSTDSKAVGVRWKPLNGFGMNHMAATGVRGIDLYYLNEKGVWSFICTAIPRSTDCQSLLVSRMDGKVREYMAYLPLYDGVEYVEFGVDSTASITLPRKAALTKGASKPIVFYGTSITQGGCASRPGMVMTSIISRALNKEVINLGFSGNARMDRSMIEALRRIDADKIVIDCLPNCTLQIMKDSAYFFLTEVAKAHPSARIFMVEDYKYGYESVDLKTANDMAEKSAYWSDLYRKLRKEGYRNLRYVPREAVDEGDSEGTVDGTHRTDLGFYRMAQRYIPILH